MADASDPKDINRLKFLARLSGEIGKRGVIDVLRKGIDHGPLHFDLFYGTPSAGNAKAEALHAQNRFSITRQLAYSMDETRRALDLGLFINGLPIATFELKNSLTKQTVEDAVEQYSATATRASGCSSSAAAWCTSRWTTARCACAPSSRARRSWFLPFNKGYNDGAGNPPNPHGLKTDYLWKEVLTPHGPDQHPRELRADRRGEEPSVPARRSASRSGRATTSSAWCGRRSPMCATTARASATSSSTRRAAANRTPSRGSRTSSSA